MAEKRNMQPFVAEPRRLIELRRRVVRRLTAANYPNNFPPT